MVAPISTKADKGIEETKNDEDISEGENDDGSDVEHEMEDVPSKDKPITKSAREKVYQYFSELNDFFGRVYKDTKLAPRKVIKIYEEQFWPFKERNVNMWNQFEKVFKIPEYADEITQAVKEAIHLHEFHGMQFLD